MVKDIRGLETLIYLGFEGVRVEGRVVIGGVKWERIPKGKKGLRCGGGCVRSISENVFSFKIANLPPPLSPLGNIMHIKKPQKNTHFFVCYNSSVSERNRKVKNKITQNS